MENRDVFEIHAEFCKVIANSKRLMIIALLEKGEMSVGEMAEEMGVSISNVSQHLRVLRAQNIVQVRKEGQTVYYRLTDPKLPKLCREIRNLLVKVMQVKTRVVDEKARKAGEG
ncbi:MAG: ArsR family transcriptional regulator [Deltaproteobacteria bacterium]|nr:MAG: ArsR family transcriptional regulator [Deltaproteobacteria bacterium]